MDWISINFESPYGINPFLQFQIQFDELLKLNIISLQVPLEFLENIDLRNITRDFQITEEQEIQKLSQELVKLKEFKKNFNSTLQELNKTKPLSLETFLGNH